jgi:uncharacterized membrane protein
MPTWLVVALSILYVFWSLVEVCGFITLCKRPYLEYSKASAHMTLAWGVSLVLVGSYLISRLFV